MRSPLAMLVALLAPGCFPWGAEIEDAHEQLAAQQAPLERDFEWDGQVVRYVCVGDPSRPAVVFVHGSPGSWDAYAHLLEDAALRRDYFLIAYDRPGYGGSGRGRERPSLAFQAAAIAALLDELGVRAPVRLVGHSLGGPVVARFAMDYPERTAGLVFVAASVDPALERTTWYQHAADRRLAQRVVPEDMLTSNREIRPLKGELEAMLPLWAGVGAPAAIIQGTRDKLVPKENANFLEAHLHGRQRLDLVPGEGHFILWSRPDLIVAALGWLDGAP